MVVIKRIKSYLRENRRLVIPSFGCFIVKEPGVILFSELISTDDGILRGLLVAEGLSEIEAAAKIDRLIFEIRHSLINEGRCQIAEFGNFTRATDGNIRFYADKVAFSQTMQQPQAAAKPATKVATTTAKPTTAQRESGQSAPRQRTTSAAKKQGSFGGFAIWFAIIVIVAALAAIAYGLYCEVTIPDDIDAEMEAKRIEIIKESPTK